MIRLTTLQYALAIDSICQDSSLYFTSILCGRAQGVVWADRGDIPQFLLIWSPYQEGFQLMGKALPESEWESFRTWFDDEIPVFLQKQGLDYFEYGADSNELAEMFQTIFAHRQVSFAPQYFYKGNQIKEPFDIPKGYEIIKVDEPFLARSDYDLDFVIEEVQNAYGDKCMMPESICYVAVYNHEVVARADMFFWNDTYGNVSVSTKELHKRKGLSGCLASHVVMDTYENGYVPVWDCTDDNIASQMTAAKCGFKKVGTFPIYWFGI